jgi:hypothetical protein
VGGACPRVAVIDSPSAKTIAADRLNPIRIVAANATEGGHTKALHLDIQQRMIQPEDNAP